MHYFTYMVTLGMLRSLFKFIHKWYAFLDSHLDHDHEVILQLNKLGNSNGISF